jgi:hypothetical protein
VSEVDPTPRSGQPGRPFRTGIVAVAPPASRDDWRERVRRIDRQGHDVLGFAAAQSPVPVLVGGNGDRVLRIAATHADIVGLVGFTSGTGQVHTDLSHFTWGGLADRIAHVRRHAGDRFPALELSVLVQKAAVTADRRRAATEFTAGVVDDVSVLLDSPFLLFGSESEIADQLIRLRDDMGVTYVTTFEHSSDALAAGAAGLRALT